MVNISVVIPVYNEGASIPNVIAEISAQLVRIGAGDHEIIIVDDHSQDGTFSLVAGLRQLNIKVIRLSRNSGSHIALRAGLAQARGEAVICMSGDGQDDPAVLGAMLDKWRAGKKVVWALRQDRKSESWIVRSFARFFYGLLLWLVDAKDITVDLSRADFFLLDRKLVDAINSCPERNTSLFGLIAWLGFAQDSVEYQRRQRKSGCSKWQFRDKLRLAKDWIIAFSGLPLKVVSLCGMVIALSGFAYASYIMVKALFVSGWLSIPGWASTVCLILILGGIQMIILGIVGEYLWRNLDESRRRPLYFIEDACSGEPR